MKMPIDSDAYLGELSVYRKEVENLCKTCDNKYKILGLSQETYCSNCIHSKDDRKDYYKPIK